MPGRKLKNYDVKKSVQIWKLLIPLKVMGITKIFSFITESLLFCLSMITAQKSKSQSSTNH